MRPQAPSVWPPIVTAFTIWFIHFMVCWTAGEIWPDGWLANVLAWVATALALPALAVHAVRVAARRRAHGPTDWYFRFAQGAVGLAVLATVFSAVPSIVYVP